MTTHAQSEVRPLYIVTNVIQHCHSSACVELGNTRVICIVRPPQQLVQEYRGSRGRVSCRVHRAVTGAEAATTGGTSRGSDASCERDLALALEGVLEQIVVLESIPQLLVEVIVEIVRDDGGLWDAATTAMSAALAVGGFDMYSIVSASSAGLLEDGSIVVDMTATQECRAVTIVTVCVSLGDSAMTFVQHRGASELPTLTLLTNAAVSGALARKNNIIEQITAQA